MDSKESSVREYVRIKIFTQEGANEADVEIPFNKQQVNIMDIRGRTIHPDGSIVNFEGKPFEKTIVKASGFKYLAKTFTLPDVHPGSIIEYRYREQSDPNYYVNESWTITGHLYTRDAHFVIRPDTGAYAARRFSIASTASRSEPFRSSRTTALTRWTSTISPGWKRKNTCHPSASYRRTWTSIYANPNDPQNETPEQVLESQGQNLVGRRGSFHKQEIRAGKPNCPTPSAPMIRLT